jgi:thiol-disulfide isomerase/thioredoxin
MNSPLKLPCVLSLLLAAGLLLATLVHAAAEVPGAEPFSEPRFRALQTEGSLVLVDVAADWCPTCRRQKSILARFQEQHPEARLRILTVDFDRQKEWVKHFKAPRQSTFILFRGEAQLWFAVAEVSEEVIFDRLLRAAAP